MVITPKSNPTSTLLCAIYDNHVFTIAYRRVETGKFFHRPAFNTMTFIQSTFLIFIGLNKAFINTMLSLIKIVEHDTLESYLFSLHCSNRQPRKMGYYNGKWNLNCKNRLRIASAIKDSLGNCSKQQADLIIDISLHHRNEVDSKPNLVKSG